MSKHAIERARERYGVELTPDDLLFVKRAVLDGSPFCVHICPEPHRRLLLAVRIRRRWMAFITTQRGESITVLSEDRLDGIRMALDERKRELRDAGLEEAIKKPFFKKKRAPSPAT